MAAEPKLGSTGISGRRVLEGGAIFALGLAAGQAAGFGRQLAVGYLLGTGLEADALTAAAAPIELWWTVLAIAVIFGFTPKLTAADPAHRPAFSQVFRSVARLGAGSSAAFFVFAEPVAVLFAPGMEREAAQEAAGLLRVVALAPFAISCSFAYSSLLMSRRRFVLPAFHQAAVNTATILGALLLYGRFGVYGFAWGYVAGAWAQFAVSRFCVRRLLADAGLEARRESQGGLLDLLSGPAPIMAQTLATEVNTAVSRAYASMFGPGMTASFEYGFKVFRVPMALMVVPLSQSLLPEISSLGTGRTARGQGLRAIRRAAWVTGICCAAVMVAMIVFRRPVVRVLFERGEFGPESTRVVATVLASYMPVIVSRGLSDVLSRTLFGLRVFRQPLTAAVVALAINAAACSLLPPVRPELIGLGAIIGFTVSAALLLRGLNRLERSPAMG